MTTFDISLRAIVLLLHFIRFGYWFVSEKIAHRQKSLTSSPTLLNRLERGVTLSLGGLLGLQLLGLSLWPMPPHSVIELIGLTMVVLGISLAMIARTQLGNNWTHAAEYQIKHNQVIVTHGVYRFIRHPIYAGMDLAYVGTELVAGSWLFIPLALILAIVAIRQARKEEKLLSTTFGKKYPEYCQTSWRFIPFVY